MEPSEQISLTEAEFWAGIAVLTRNYHAVNKKIFACVIREVHKIKSGIAQLQQASAECLLQTWRTQTSVQAEVLGETELQTLLDGHCQAEVNAANSEGVLICYKFLTKKLTDNIEAVALIDFTNNSYTCKFPCDTFDDFVVTYRNATLTVETSSTRDLGTRWAEFVLKPKLQKWCQPVESMAGKSHTSSLQLVDMESYNELYKQLKRKYAAKALKCWQAAGESTDPLKFVYEDLAIAAYLICLWQRVGTPPSAFADLGCGNGLLVYLLSEEGYRGYGYDVRARKIWAHYPPSTQLIEQTIEPCTFALPAEVDWLIGNHSDELSPWLPVLAARSSYRMRYFLLPCCSYELSGAKFQRRNSSVSAYQDFYAYLRFISVRCGYKTLQDRLKIPSTKRLALVGVERTHAQCEYAKVRSEIEDFVQMERSKHGHHMAETEIKLRERHEMVRNCTQVDRKIINALVLQIFQMLLATSEKNTEAAQQVWQPGGRMCLRDIANKLSSADLAHIKAECGGIKTLLRNRHEIFESCGGDLVGIRRPRKRELGKKQTLKKRTCFFQQHHPDGCPLTAAECTFIH